MNEQQDQNLARLVQAGMGEPNRPEPGLRRDTLERLRCELRAQHGVNTPAQAVGSQTTETRNLDRVDKPSRLASLQEQIEIRKETIMSKLFTGWRFGLTATAGAAAIVLFVMLAAPQASGRAAEIMANGARAMGRLTSVHFRGQLRSAPNDNFSAITPTQGFVTVELWKEFTPQTKWRVEKPGRTAVMDGQSTVLFIKPDYAVKVSHATASAFDTDWLQQMADLSDALEREVAAIKSRGWAVRLASESGMDGKPKSVITVEAKSGLPVNDYLKNAFFLTADTRRVYVFDNQTEALEAVKIYLHGASGDQLVFELSQIEYNRPIDPAVFQLQLPANVSWQEDMKVLPDNAKYSAMTVEQAARTFLEACGRQDWTEVGKFMSPVTESFKQDRGRLQVISIGKSFTSALTLIGGAHFVPYEIKLNTGEIIKHNLALKRDRQTQRWFIDGGI